MITANKSNLAYYARNRVAHIIFTSAGSNLYIQTSSDFNLGSNLKWEDSFHLQVTNFMNYKSSFLLINFGIWTN